MKLSKRKGWWRSKENFVDPTCNNGTCSFKFVYQLKKRKESKGREKKVMSHFKKGMDTHIYIQKWSMRKEQQGSTRNTMAIII